MNSIWEGPGNIMALDVLRALNKNPLSAEVVMKEIKIGSRYDKRLDSLSRKLETCLLTKVWRSKYADGLSNDGHWLAGLPAPTIFFK